MSSTEDRTDASHMAQPPGLKRTDFQRNDLSIPDARFIQSRVEIGPEAPFVKHPHPGGEIIYILEGSPGIRDRRPTPEDMQCRGRLDRPRRSGPRGQERRQQQRGELATYVVEKGKPPITLAE